MEPHKYHRSLPFVWRDRSYAQLGSIAKGRLRTTWKMIFGDSVLSGFIEVTSYAIAIGFLVPVYMTQESWEGFVEVGDDIPLLTQNPRMKERRILEILLQALRAARETRGEEIANFDMYRLTSRAERKNTGRIAVCKRFLVRCGLDDLEEPIIIIDLSRSHADQ